MSIMPCGVDLKYYPKNEKFSIKQWGWGAVESLLLKVKKFERKTLLLAYLVQITALTIDSHFRCCTGSLCKILRVCSEK